MFDIPSGSSGLTAEKRTTSAGSWTALTEKSSSDEFSGVEAVRFDYPNSKAYVSAAFAADSDDLWLRVLNGATPVGTFVRIAAYYDNRATAVISTWDDWYSGISPSSVTGAERNDEHLAMVEAHAARGLWASSGMNPGGALGVSPAPDWSKVATAVATGFFEPVNHSYSHKDARDVDWSAAVAEDQVADAVASMQANMDFPAQSKRGSDKYVYGWIMPYGQTNDYVKAALGASKHLTIGRLSVAAGAFGSTHPEWDDTFGLYGQIAPTINATSATSEATMNAAYNAVVGKGRAYMFYSYPYWWDWEDAGSPVLAHLDHISGHADHWYVGLGHFFLYRLLTDRVRLVRS